MIPSWARAGAKVVCVDGELDFLKTNGGNRRPSDLGFKLPTEKEIYTIRSTRIIDDHKIGVLLQEIDNSHLRTVTGQEPAFTIYRFSPLVTLEDDMKLFEHLKNPSLVDKLDLLAERMNELAAD